MTLIRMMALAALLSPAPALAADIAYEEYGEPAGAAFTPDSFWNGLYVGGHLGGVFSSSEGELGILTQSSGFVDLDNREDANDDGVGLSIGAHLGADFQLGNLVVGAVTDLTFLGADYETSASFGGNGVSIRREVDFVGTTRARLGYSFDRTLVYGTAGLAYGDVENEVTLTDSDGLVVDGTTDGSDDSFGYAVGGGLDFALFDNVSIGAEYLYTNLGDSTFSAAYEEDAGGFSVANEDDDIDFHRIEAKVSYRFF